MAILGFHLCFHFVRGFPFYSVSVSILFLCVSILWWVSILFFWWVSILFVCFHFVFVVCGGFPFCFWCVSILVRNPARFMPDSNWIPLGFPMDSDQIPGNSGKIPAGFRTDSDWILVRFRSNSSWIQIDSGQIPSGFR